MTVGQHTDHISNGQHLNRHADRPYVFYFFLTAQKNLKFSQRTIGTFASRTSQRTNPSLQKSQISEAILEHHIDKIIKSEKFTHPPKTDNKGEKSYFNRLKFELNLDG